MLIIKENIVIPFLLHSPSPGGDFKMKMHFVSSLSNIIYYHHKICIFLIALFKIYDIVHGRVGRSQAQLFQWAHQSHSYLNCINQ